MFNIRNVVRFSSILGAISGVIASTSTAAYAFDHSYTVNADDAHSPLILQVNQPLALSEIRPQSRLIWATGTLNHRLEPGRHELQSVTLHFTDALSWMVITPMSSTTPLALVFGHDAISNPEVSRSTRLSRSSNNVMTFSSTFSTDSRNASSLLSDCAVARMAATEIGVTNYRSSGGLGTIPMEFRATVESTQIPGIEYSSLMETYACAADVRNPDGSTATFPVRRQRNLQNITLSLGFNLNHSSPDAVLTAQGETVQHICPPGQHVIRNVRGDGIVVR